MKKYFNVFQFVKIIKNARRNHNLVCYYFKKWDDSVCVVKDLNKELTDARYIIKELKEKIENLVKANESYCRDNRRLRKQIKSSSKEKTPNK